MTDLQDLLTTLAAAARPAVVIDFDGTISRIVDQPDAARPVPGAVEALNALDAEGVRVSVLSGRPVAFLQKVLEGRAPGLGLIGHSGLERANGADITVAAEVAPWLPLVRAGHDRTVAAAPEQLWIEDKGLSFSIHYRGAANLEAAALDLARDGSDGGLSVEIGKMHAEVRPPVSIDKGTALAAELASSDLDWLLFAGDDVVDLPAFTAVRGSGIPSGFCVAIGTEESPEQLTEAADIVVDSPQVMVELLASMVAARASRRK